MESPRWHGGDTVGAAGPPRSPSWGWQGPRPPWLPPWVLWGPSTTGTTHSLDVRGAPTDHLPSGLASPVICSGVMRLMSLSGDGMRALISRAQLGNGPGGLRGGSVGDSRDKDGLCPSIWAALGAQGVVGSPQRAAGSEPGWLRSLGARVCCSGGLCALVVLGCPRAHVSHCWLSCLQPHPPEAGGGGGSGPQEMQKQTRRAEKKRSLIGNQQQPRPWPAGGSA